MKSESVESARAEANRLTHEMLRIKADPAAATDKRLQRQHAEASRARMDALNRMMGEAQGVMDKMRKDAH